MSPSIIFALAFTAMAISAFLTHRFCNPDSAVYILDHPNDRSLHDRPIPRGGGLAILIAIGICGAAVALAYPDHGLASISLAIMIVAVVSFLDDRFCVSPIYRLVAHALAAAIILYTGFSYQRLELPGGAWELSYVGGVAISALFIVWMTNLYNFMDGMDGFAGGMAVFGFGTFAALGWIAGHDSFFIINLIIACASAGFLYFNFPPAQVFMGDIGSSTLGLMAATLSLWGARDGIFPFWVAVLVFSPFIMDSTATLVWRLLRREKIWQAHKTHFYQRLVQAGWGHRGTVLIEYVIMLGCGLTTLWMMSASAEIQAAIVVAWALFYFSFFFWIARLAVR